MEWVLGLRDFSRGSIPSRWLLKRGESLREGAHLIGVGPVLVLGSVAGVAEGLAAAFVLAHVRLLTRVRPQVRLQVFEA